MVAKNIVLDIDATLVHTHGDDDDFKKLKLFNNSKIINHRGRIYTMLLKDVTHVPGSGEEMKLYGVYRPYLKEFIEFCFDYFDNVIIWSAGKEKYVEKMCEIMFTDSQKQPILIYNYDQCQISGDDITKPLDKLYKDKKLKGRLNHTNTFVLDDREDTFSSNHNNGILIPPYVAELTHAGIERKDECLLKLMSWLITVENSNKDIRLLNKKNIFTTSNDEYMRKMRKMEK